MAKAKSGSAKWGKYNKNKSSAKARGESSGLLDDLEDDFNFVKPYTGK